MTVNAVISEFKKIRLLLIMVVSVHTYVTKNLCNMLKLRAEQKEQLQPNSLGDQHHRTKNYICEIICT